tara:strand:- start:1715 stop:1876 length:162 start_codon:yes stop_codon:yes gene_type:complete
MEDDKSVINMDFASLYPSIMKDYSDLITQEMIRVKRDETIDELLNSDDDDGKE